MSIIALDTRPKKIFAIVWALLEIFLFAGLFFGWGTLVFILKEDGVYGDLCDIEANEPGDKMAEFGIGTDTNMTSYSAPAFVEYDALSKNVTAELQNNDTNAHSIKGFRREIGCPDQDKKFNLGFTIVSGLWPFFFGILGQLGHKKGTRFLRISSILSFTSGSFFVAFTTPELPWLAFIGLFLYGISGCSLLFSNLQLSYLFENGRSIVSSLMTGSFDSSIATQLYIKIGYDNGIKRQHCYIFIACLHLVAFISTFLWLPKFYIQLPEIKDETIFVGSNGEETTNENEKEMQKIDLADRNGVENDRTKMEEQDDVTVPMNTTTTKTKDSSLSLKGHLCSHVFLLHVFWYSILQLRFFYFVGTLNPWLERVSHSEEEVSSYTNTSMYFMLGGIITSFTAGSFFEMQKRIYKDSKSSRKRNLAPAVIPLIAGTALGVLLSVMQMISADAAIYASFISVTAFRSFLYAIGNGYLSEMFPSKYLNSLSGILMVLTGIASFFQYILFYWTESYTGAFLHVDIVLVCLVLTSLVHPVYLWLQCRKLD
ncbi:equilibrative nucleobase transporter 1-like [Ylistrum balloti]|uniref:equilibrative nucleobase transporter 1-like n=1 Tax=Ylistrum balloti TaxID=509963 RepID=UPI0029059DCB|nr:equilibrative nucleobase transporter 1-like [Ylistrum balloti]